MNSDAPLGIVYGMPADQYHAIDALSNSALSMLNRSPRHYWANYLNPDRPERSATAAMAAGTLAHSLVLEPGTVSNLYAVRPEGMDGRTKEGKQWAADNAGRIIVTAEQMATAEAQRAAVLAVPDLAELLASGSPEVSTFWIDHETGTHCKMRADWVHPLADGRVILLDLKTTQDASPEQFGRSVWTYGYHRQDAWYTRGFALAGGPEVAAFVFAAVTGSYPFIAVPYTLDDQARWQGQEECDELLATYAECRNSNNWPAYGDGVQMLSLPGWAQRDMETEVSYV